MRQSPHLWKSRTAGVFLRRGKNRLILPRAIAHGLNCVNRCTADYLLHHQSRGSTQSTASAHLSFDVSRAVSETDWALLFGEDVAADTPPRCMTEPRVFERFASKTFVTIGTLVAPGYSGLRLDGLTELRKPNVVLASKTSKAVTPAMSQGIPAPRVPAGIDEVGGREDEL